MVSFKKTIFYEIAGQEYKLLCHCNEDSNYFELLHKTQKPKPQKNQWLWVDNYDSIEKAEKRIKLHEN